MTDYELYRGKCKEFSEAYVKDNPEFELVRGYYHEPLWGTKEEHWWTKNKITGIIFDPTCKQFPSGGIADFYEEFDGTFECSECGKEILEKDVVMAGSYPVCSDRCYGRLVGVL